MTGFSPSGIYLLSLLVLFLSYVERKKRKRSNFLFYLSFALFFGSIYYFTFLHFETFMIVSEKIKYVVYFFLVLSVVSLTPFLISKKKDSRMLKIINGIKGIVRMRRYYRIKKARAERNLDIK